jgi:hypothetical protein
MVGVSAVIGIGEMRVIGFKLGGVSISTTVEMLVIPPISLMLDVRI